MIRAHTADEGIEAFHPVDQTLLNQKIQGAVDCRRFGRGFQGLEAIQQIESARGRPSKRPRNAPPTIDVDILYVGNLTLSTPDIVIPHPRLHLRRFVLVPLAEIRPELRLPGQHHTVSELLAALEDPAAVQLSLLQWNLLQ